MNAPDRTVRPLVARTGLGLLLLVAAVILFVIAAIIAFADANYCHTAGLVYIGLACLAAAGFVP